MILYSISITLQQFLLEFVCVRITRVGRHCEPAQRLGEAIVFTLLIKNWIASPKHCAGSQGIVA